MLGERFIAAWQKKGTLAVYRRKSTGELQKQGGNVICYVCTPDGRVIHAIPFAPQPEFFLQQLRWALQVHRAGRVAQAHRERRKGHHWMRRVHDFLARHPLARIETIEREAFTRLVGQRYDPQAALAVEEVDEARWRLVSAARG